jgi:hypothetical protein
MSFYKCFNKNVSLILIRHINDSSITDFGENNAFNFEAILLSSESQGKRQRKSRSHGYP